MPGFLFAGTKKSGRYKGKVRLYHKSCRKKLTISKSLLSGVYLVRKNGSFFHVLIF